MKRMLFFNHTRQFALKSQGPLILLMLTMAFACCKGDPDDEPKPTASRMDLTNDSLYLYAKEIYFWNSLLPTYDNFNPRQYKNEAKAIDNYDNTLWNLIRYSGSPEYKGGEIKYSYIEDIADRNPDVIAAMPNAKASVDLEGNGNDTGIHLVTAVQTSSTVYKLYLQSVHPGSPAALAGLTRGAYITKVNSTTIGSVAGFEAERTVINNTIYKDPSTLVLEGFKADGSPFTVTLNKTSYKSSPVIKTNVLTAGARKIGYLAFARFSDKANSETALVNAFSNFETQGVTDLVIDLRYNGGGYVTTAETLTNLIAPNSASGTMYVEHFNSNLKSRKQSDPSILSNQPWLDASEKIVYINGRIRTLADASYAPEYNTAVFTKRGSLNIQNVVFIVTGRSASASELVINSLKPKMTVKLVGAQTYGKPIGFFPIRLENKYDVYYSLFETKNSLGEGGYYNGMGVDVPVNSDYGDYDFGNPLDLHLKAAINVLAPGAPVSTSSLNKVMSVAGAKSGSFTPKTLGGLSDTKDFVGLIEDGFNKRQQ